LGQTDRVGAKSPILDHIRS